MDIDRPVPEGLFSFFDIDSTHQYDNTIKIIYCQGEGWSRKIAPGCPGIVFVLGITQTTENE
jgi:hypothetical protein